MIKKILGLKIAIAVVVTAVATFVASSLVDQEQLRVAVYETFQAPSTDVAASVAAVVKAPFNYDFRVPGTLVEVGGMQDSSSPYWWLNSGAYFYLQDGIGMTHQDELPKYSKWRVAYEKANARDTDNGYHPQNIFRMLTRSKWQDVRQDVAFKINEVNLSDSPERNAWSGVLLFNRYQDGDNLYYAGIRMDGRAVIKKKLNGVYYTLSEKTFFQGVYNRDTNPNLIPVGRWIGLRSSVRTNADGSVSIKLYVDPERDGTWALAADAVDKGSNTGGAPIRNQGYGGLRTDFMDAAFDDYRVNTSF